MDDKNTNGSVKDVIKRSMTKSNEKTQVFVLPPELVKGLLFLNKKPKVLEVESSDAERSKKSSDEIIDDGNDVQNDEILYEKRQNVAHENIKKSADCENNSICISNLGSNLNIEAEEIQSKLVVKADNILKSNTRNLNNCIKKNPVNNIILQSDKESENCILKQNSSRCQNDEEYDKFRNNSENNEHVDSNKTSQMKTISAFNNSVVFEKGNNLNTDQTILNEVTDNKQNVICEDIKFIVEDVIEESTCNKITCRTSILNPIDSTNYDSDKVLLKSNSVDNIDEQHLKIKQFVSNTQNEDAAQNVGVLKTYINKQTLKNQIQSDVLDKKSSLVIPSIKNVHETINQIKVLDTRNPSESTDYRVLNDLESINTKSCSKSLSMDIKTYSLTPMKSEHFDNCKTLINNQDKISKIKNISDSNMLAKQENHDCIKIFSKSTIEIKDNENITKECSDSDSNISKNIKITHDELKNAVVPEPIALQETPIIKKVQSPNLVNSCNKNNAQDAEQEKKSTSSQEKKKAFFYDIMEMDKSKQLSLSESETSKKTCVENREKLEMNQLTNASNEDETRTIIFDDQNNSPNNLSDVVNNDVCNNGETAALTCSNSNSTDDFKGFPKLPDVNSEKLTFFKIRAFIEDKEITENLMNENENENDSADLTFKENVNAEWLEKKQKTSESELKESIQTDNVKDKEDLLLNFVEPEKILEETCSNVIFDDLMECNEIGTTAIINKLKGKRKISSILTNLAQKKTEETSNFIKIRKTSRSLPTKFEDESKNLEIPNENSTEKSNFSKLETSIENPIKTDDKSSSMDHNTVGKKPRGRQSKNRLTNVDVSDNKLNERDVCKDTINNIHSDKFAGESTVITKNGVECQNKSEEKLNDENLIQMSLPKKRRGRPPKVKLPNSDVTEVHKDPFGDFHVEKAAVSDKNDSEFLSKAEGTLNEETITLTKKRRGRHAKKKTENSVTSVSPVDDENDVSGDKCVDLNGEEDFVARKDIENQSNAGEKSRDENFDQNNLPKKRRGRQPKRVLNFDSPRDKFVENIPNVDTSDISNVELRAENAGVLSEKNFENENTADEELHRISLPRVRRGRRPKTDASNFDVSISGLDKTASPENTTNDINSTMHREKSGVANDVSVEPQSEANGKLDTNDLPKKRRGRRRKSSISNFNITDVKSDEVVNRDEISNSSKDFIEKSSEKESENHDPKISNGQDQSCCPKKRRGRPRKADIASTSKIEVTLEDNKLNDTAEAFSLADSEQEQRRSSAGVCLTRNYERKKKRIALQDSDSDESESVVDEDNDLNYKSDGSGSAGKGRRIFRKRAKYSMSMDSGKKRGRPKLGQERDKIDNEYTPHHSQVRQFSGNKKRKLAASPDSEKVSNATKMVKCGKCQKEFMKRQWPHHNLYLHNDLAWLEGTEKPDYDNDEKLLKRVLAVSIKKRKGHLMCETCATTKRSVAGYLSHVMFCGKDPSEIQTLMVTCPGCKAVIKPSSLEYHERLHKIQAEESKKLLNSVQDEGEDVGQKSKRKAAERATARISEFTELVKDEKDAPDKKSNSYSLKKLIQKPEIRRRIPGMLSKKWKQDLLDNQKANCSQIGCQYSSDLLDDLKSHYAICNFIPNKNFTCRICKFECSSENDIVKHAYENHSLEDKEDPNLNLSDSESSMSDNSEKMQSDNKQNRETEITARSFVFNETTDLSSKKFKFLFKNGANYGKYSSQFLSPIIWTLDFELRNYKFNLFKEYVPNVFKLLDSKEAITYVPEHEESMLTMNKKYSMHESTVEGSWKRWKRFEGQCVQDNPTFFTGGPVWAVAWLPIPTSMTFSEDVSEFIAISTHINMNKEYDLKKNTYAGRNIIQIWNVGALDKKTDEMANPKLAYAIAHEGGTVWCLEWCPSGCYQHEDLPGFTKTENVTKRIGLLAAACSDGNIRVYSLIFPQDLPKYRGNQANVNDAEDSSERYPIYNTEPSLVLVLNIQKLYSKQQTWQVTKLSWTKENGHNTIVAGFSNGCVAFWDLSVKYQILKTTRGNTTFLMPYRHFLAHQHAVTMVCLVSQDNKRYLATASVDRVYKFWDCESISIEKNTFKKGIVTDGAWLNNWCCCFISSDDALNMGHNYLQCLALRDYTYKSYNILPTNSASYTVSASDFGNSIACGTLAGEVLAIFPHQLLYVRNMDQTLPRKRLYSVVSSIDVIDFQNEKNKESKSDKNIKDEKTDYSFMPSTYTDSKDRFGLKFCDKMSNFQKNWYPQKFKSQKKTLSCEAMDEVPVEQYPFMSVNKVAWSPNARSFSWLAVAYQNGFVRLIPFKTKNSTSQCHNLLMKHIKNVMASAQDSTSSNSSN